jgi:hypothetical protein
MNAHIRNIALLFVVMHLVNKLDQKDERVILGARTAYATFLLTALLLNAFVRRLVIKKADGRLLEVPLKPTLQNPTPDPNVRQRLTVQEYDISLLDATRSQLFLQTALLVFLHWKMGSVAPLILQAIMGFVRQLDDPLIKIHLLGHRDTGALERPFKSEPNPLLKLLGLDPSRNQASARQGSDSHIDDTAVQSRSQPGETQHVTPVGDVGNVSDSSADEAIAQDSASDDEQKSMRGKKDD